MIGENVDCAVRGGEIANPSLVARRIGDLAIGVYAAPAYLAAGLAGLGVLWLPDYMARLHVARGELVRLFDGWHAGPMPLSVVWPESRHISAKLRVFVEWVATLMAVHAPMAAARRTR